MARHRKTLTHEALAHRYANALGNGVTYGQAYDALATMPIEKARDLVESVESVEAGGRAPGRRRSFARSQPTTSLGGLTR